MTVVTKQMGITHAEFARLLPRALDANTFSGHAPHYDVTLQAGGTVAIDLGPESERRIALMRIASTPVTLTFSDVSDDAKAAFLERFDRAYQRGGG